MVVFSGIISDGIQARTLKKRGQHFFRQYAITMSIIMVVSGIFWFIFWIEAIMEWIILLIASIAVGLLLLYNPRKKFSWKWNYHVVINAEQIVVESYLWKKPLEKSTQKIKKVLDEGDCYYVIYSDINNCIVCQKDLLVEGTLEEFENIFAGKIVRKLKKESRKSKTTSAK